MKINVNFERIPATRYLNVTTNAYSHSQACNIFREIAYRHYTPKGGYDPYIVESWWTDSFTNSAHCYLNELWPGDVRLIAPHASDYEPRVREELASYRVIQAHAAYNPAADRIRAVIYGLVYLAKRETHELINVFSQSWSPTLHGCFRVRSDSHIQTVQSVTKLRRL